MAVLVFGARTWLGAAELDSGPVVEDVTGTNAVIRWATDVATGSRVQFGTESGRLTRRGEGELGRQHRVLIGNLQPGTKYYFTVGTARYALATNSFTTAGRNTVSGAPSTGPPFVATGTPPVAAKTVPPRAAPPTRETWGYMASLQDHFDRHGNDFNAKTPDDYARQAWEFLQRARAGGLQLKLDEDGVVRVFDPRSGAFAAYNRNGTTKTYFKPGSRDYFERQPGRVIQPKDLPFR